MSDLKIGHSVSFSWAGILRTGKVIGETKGKVLVRFNYKHDQVKEKWIGKSVISALNGDNPNDCPYCHCFRDPAVVHGKCLACGRSLK